MIPRLVFCSFPSGQRSAEEHNSEWINVTFPKIIYLMVPGGEWRTKTNLGPSVLRQEGKPVV